MCMEHGVQINFLSGTGQPYAKISSPQLTATVQTRREQLMAFLDRRGITLAQAFITGKIKNQVNTLKYFAKYRKEAQQETYGLVMEMCIRDSHLFSGSSPNLYPHWDLQHKEIHVNIDTKPQNYFFIEKRTKRGGLKHQDLYLNFKKVHDVSMRKKPGYQDGIIVITGHVPYKHMEFIFVKKERRETIITVSYTHLDVYKRQNY